MPACSRLARFTLVLCAAWAATVVLSGCAAGRSSSAPVMFDATAAPSSAAEVFVVDHVYPTADPLAYIELLPAFSATCRPDFRFERFESATVFVDARPARPFEFLPMFGSTCAPANRTLPRSMDMGATIVVAPAPTPDDRAASAEPETP